MARWGTEDADTERPERAPVRAHVEPGQVPTDAFWSIPEACQLQPPPSKHLKPPGPCRRLCLLPCSAQLHMGHEYLKTSAKPSHKQERASCVGFLPSAPFPTSYSLQETRESLTIYSDFIFIFILLSSSSNH